MTIYCYNFREYDTLSIKTRENVLETHFETFQRRHNQNLKHLSHLFLKENLNKFASSFLAIQLKTNKGMVGTGTAPSNIDNNTERGEKERCSLT